MVGAQSRKFYDCALALNRVLARCVITATRPPVVDEIDFGPRFERWVAGRSGEVLIEHLREEWASDNLTNLRRPKEQTSEMRLRLCQHLRLIVIKRINGDGRDAGGVEQSSHPVPERLDARVPKRDNDPPIVEQRRIEDRPKHVQNNGLMFLFDSIDSVYV
jgi:hypothetical protein